MQPRFIQWYTSLEPSYSGYSVPLRAQVKEGAKIFMQALGIYAYMYCNITDYTRNKYISDANTYVWKVRLNILTAKSSWPLPK
jgi:hypothetical protein